MRFLCHQTPLSWEILIFLNIAVLQDCHLVLLCSETTCSSWVDAQGMDRSLYRGIVVES